MMGTQGGDKTTDLKPVEPETKLNKMGGLSAGIAQMIKKSKSEAII